MKRIRAFTLVESLLVFLLVAVMLLLTVTRFKALERRMTEERFLQSFEQNYLYTQKKEIVTWKLSMMTYESATQSIEFKSTGEDMAEDGEKIYLAIPATVKLTSGKNTLIFKAGSGNNSTLVAYIFECSAMKRKVTYQLQLGSGRYEKTERLLK